MKTTGNSMARKRPNVNWRPLLVSPAEARNEVARRTATPSKIRKCHKIRLRRSPLQRSHCFFGGIKSF